MKTNETELESVKKEIVLIDKSLGLAGMEEEDLRDYANSLVLQVDGANLERLYEIRSSLLKLYQLVQRMRL